MDVECKVGLLYLPPATTILAPYFIICINSLKVFDHNCKKVLQNSRHFATEGKLCTLLCLCTKYIDFNFHNNRLKTCGRNHEIDRQHFERLSQNKDLTLSTKKKVLMRSIWVEARLKPMTFSHQHRPRDLLSTF